MKASNKWVVAAVVALAPGLAVMDTTIVSVILSQLQNAFHTDFQTITWVASAYFLAQAGVIPVVGYVSDRIGSKVVFLTALAVFIATSLLCALAPTKEALITFRVLQGIGGGALVPMTYAIIFRIFPPNERGLAVSITSIPVLMAPTFGPTLGGYLSTSFNWNAVFLINVPIGIVVLLLALLVVPGQKSDQSEQTKGAGKRFDIQGLVLSMVGVTALVYGIAQAGSNDWGEATVLIPLLIGVAVLIVFTVVELRVSDPVLDLRLFMNSTFTIANLLAWTILGVFSGSLFLLPLFFENVRGDTALTTGFFLIGQGLAAAAGITIVGMLYNRLGPRILTVFGLLLLIGGTYELTQVNVNTTGQELQVWLFLRGFGMGFVYQPLQTLALSVVSNKGMAKASSLVNVTRQMTTAAAVAALTAYLTGQTTTHATAINNALQAGLQTHHFTDIAATCSLAAGPTQDLVALKACVVQHATAAGIADTFWVILILSVVCVPLALVMGRDPAIEALKQVKAPVAEVHRSVTPHVISTLTANGEEIMGPEILLWHCPKNDIVSGSLLTVESNHFCVLKSFGAILNVYETGQHVVQTPDSPLYGSLQLAFSGEPIPWQYEALYINRAKLVVKASGVTLSSEMAEVDYTVDYYIHVATREDAIHLVQRMPYFGHTLNIRGINTYAGPVIEEAVNRLLLITPLRQVRGPQTQDLPQLVHQHLQPFLSSYGITLDMVKVQVSPRGERTTGQFKMVR
jgi:DHA2 family multidrug resistance protein